ncbi:hypothetical protein IW140_006196 [Coemansia sp. RSA 1813]|nr:hypothetical protein EV178_005645 [Coemansia sp. RSA 1646]KAJ1766530.1 hypothetical protein LPJ74_005832 [Coemansia sp. RSA 1843]KAJ2092240.1 hypothetical protein IW138_001308 [Coemansia sp. RSA 986]KAJ2211286.1 hypothetical protein EV179_005596 [Coemansia sp. RSA 487]KAJ2563200.1 hypothetical protein IW140_006196 [Coemansia sp. RSA 1813]
MPPESENNDTPVSVNQSTIDGVNGAAVDRPSEKSVDNPNSTAQEAVATSSIKPRWWENKALDERPVDGAYGWAVVISGSTMLMFSMGFVNSYGAYQTYYHLNQFPNEPVSTLSWIGTLQFAGMCIFGIPAGIMCERLDTRLVTFVGGLIMGVSLVIASFCDSAVWKLILTQGIVFSIGASMVFIPATSIPSQWFTKYRALAIGVVVAGSGIGGLWLTPATRGMIENLGTSWALRITGIITFAATSVSSLFMRNRLHVEGREKIVDFSVFRDIRFIFVFIGAVCGVAGYFTPFFELPTFAIQKMGKSESFGNNLVTIINAASILGRVGTGQLAPLMGTINTMTGCTLIASLSILILWLPFKTTGTVLACAIIYGLFCGGLISLLPVVIADLWGVQRISTIIGLVYIASFTGGMVGAPASGALVDHIGHGSDFKPAIIFSGVFLLAASVFFTFLRFATNKNPLARV